MVEVSYFTNGILPPVETLADAIRDSLSYHLGTTRRQAYLHNLFSALTPAGVDVCTSYHGYTRFKRVRLGRRHGILGGLLY
jgi:hypothetical protein